MALLPQPAGLIQDAKLQATQIRARKRVQNLHENKKTGKRDATGDARWQLRPPDQPDSVGAQAGAA
ncbi:hypothetical protein MyNCGM70_02270 [Achromobacter xylosoxidans]